MDNFLAPWWATQYHATFPPSENQNEIPIYDGSWSIPNYGVYGNMAREFGVVAETAVPNTEFSRVEARPWTETDMFEDPKRSEAYVEFSCWDREEAVSTPTTNMMYKKTIFQS